MNRNLKYIPIAFAALFILAFVSFRLMKRPYNQSLDHDALKQLKTEIRESQVLPDQFLAAYNLTSPITNTTGLLKDDLLNRPGRSCPCLMAARINWEVYKGLGKRRFVLNSHFLARELEKDFTQEQCLSYWAANYDFTYGIKGVDSLAQFLFDQPFDSLGMEEMVNISLMLDNPVRYNPKRHPERVREEVERVMKDE